MSGFFGAFFGVRDRFGARFFGHNPLYTCGFVGGSLQRVRGGGGGEKHEGRQEGSGNFFHWVNSFRINLHGALTYPLQQTG